MVEKTSKRKKEQKINEDVTSSILSMSIFVQYKKVLSVAFLLFVVVGMFLGAFFVEAQSLELSPSTSISEEGVSVEQELKSKELQTTGEVLISRVAPGEFLLLSVALLNFGDGLQVDAIINYEIFDIHNNKILSENETVTIGTTARFAKLIQIPQDTPPGEYIARSSVLYQDHLVPSATQFSFMVEQKIVGMFLSQFILYVSIAIGLSIVFAVICRLVIKRQRLSRLIPHDYGQIPRNKRLFYEVISDAIMQIRRRVGDEAFDIVAGIDGLKVDENGRVLAIEKRPSKILASLVLAYEKSLGEKLNF